MNPEEQVIKALAELEIAFTRYEHPAVFTVAEARLYDGRQPGVHVKNLFLRNRKGDRHYLMIAEEARQVDLKALARRIDETALSLASPERLLAHLGLPPGSVSPFGLLNDAQRQVIVLLDAALPEAEQIGFHPNINTATLFISGGNLMKFLNWRGNPVKIITF